MATFYNNLPQPTTTDSTKKTLKIFDAYTNKPVQVDAAVYDAMSGFFGGRGFGEDAAHSMAYVIIKQAIIDKYNPLQLLDTLQGLQNVELSALITQILNYNRFKTSSLGTASPFTPRDEVARNILA
jgi:hypothetical protein